MKYQPIIGLEVHVELKTESKMFCSCSTGYFGKPANSHVCPVCLGLPGALPVPNKKAIEWCVMTGLALNCQIPQISKFDRKNYFYPDLPKGYQISQYDQPFAIKGWLKLKTESEKRKTIRIRRVHLEEDTAKLIHIKKGEPLNRDYSLTGITPQEDSQEEYTLIDFNRSGMPLMEIVTEPDIYSPAEAKAYLKKLQQIIRYLGVSDCDMEKGSMRCEANISMTQTRQELPDYKVEIKNLNSFRFVEKALEYEIERQRKLLEIGKKLRQETRGWDEIKQMTFPQRVKETAADYRYFPEPDIPPIKWTKSQISNLKSQISELPDAKIIRFTKQYGLSQYQSEILVATKEKADYCERAIKAGRKHDISPQEIANVIINKRIAIERYLPSELIELLIKKKRRQIIDKRQIKKWVKVVLAKNQKAVGDYKKGKKGALEFLMGQIQRLVKGKANPRIARQILEESLKES